MRFERTAACVAFALAAALLPARVAAAATPPAYTYSHYVKTTNPDTIDALGCREGRMNVSGITVLDFGRPAYANGSYGTIIFGANTFRSIAQVEATAKAWLTGWYRCSTATPRAVLGVGTSNYKGTTTFAHGRAWAQMINNLVAWLGDRNYLWQVDVAGAIDMELSWNTVANSRAWGDGYGSIDTRPYYDFGDAAGCPPYGSCNNGWTQEDVWYVAWGQPAAWPLPQIYTENGSMATQWYRLSLYAYVAHGYRMHIAGVMTQYGACIDVGGCTNGTQNTPAQGWTQLHSRLNADSRTAQQLAWSTDINWRNA